MKRFLSIILAIAMVIALIPAVFAEGETTRTYEFSSTAVGITNGTTGASSIDDYNYNSKNNGWKYVSINSAAANLTITDKYRVYQLQPKYLRMCANRTASSLYIADGIQLALAIEKPSSTPGFYKATVKSGNTLSSSIQFYMGKWDGYQNSVDTYMTEKTKFNNGVTPVADGEAELAGIVYNDGANDFVLGIDTYTETPTTYDFTSLTLEELASPSIALSLDKTTLGVGETATASVNVTSEQVTQKLLNDYVTYESDNEAVAKVSELGEITTYETGTATITATVGGESYTQTINVVDLSGISVQYDTYVTSNQTAASANLITYGVWTINGRIEYLKTTSTEDYPYSWDQTAKTDGTGLSDSTYKFVAAFKLAANNDEYTAYKIRIPAKGDYMTSLYYLATNNVDAARSGSMYILPPEGITDIEGSLASATPVLSNINFYDETNQFKTTKEVVFSAPVAGEYLMVWKNTGDTGTRITPVKLTLNGGDGKAPIWANMSVENSELEVEGTTTLTSTVYTSDGKAATDTTGITYTSTNTGVATVSGTTVTAVGAGTAKIQAKNGDYVLGEVDVTVNTPEYTAAFNPDDTGSETVNEVVSPLVYAKDGTKLDIVPSATKVGNVWQVSTDAESGDYKFLYWAKGLSTGVKRRIVSRSASFNYDAENEGNYLIAVYEKENTTTSGDEYYNANGQLLENGNTLPYLAGYVGAATGWEDRGDGMHVAIFPEENRATYTITVDGKEDTYNYGDPVVCTADAEKDGKKFFGWRKTVNGAPAELVSASTSYTFKAWETCEVTAVYEDEAPVFSGVARKIVLGTFNVGNETAIMAEFIGFGNDVVERGISLNGTEIAMTTKEYNQFTIINNENVENISGYAILADGTKVIYNK